ncbi:beta-N-acetylhexosaminidase [Aurantiacibacter gangjinensis]|uniref:beta-N-acetylhexosaminidase n=1 Tax=Aurantiacibacter gangjinensis TaxID=502682 RepID=A0A0G9MSD3_9SPHN|nr:beta-N-acetylhexosaminidase [Aurantiacibacter gangjinensis]APE27056.1 Beta N-acetyl-glucosaminidase [Aurantiacibacter gangjinensis]KLE33484.1 beta-hexosaminidase [Aurantiacibacter gangjinensis]
MTPAILSLSGLTLTDDERAFFKEADPAGYILFGRNIETREQLRALTDSLRDLHGRDDLLISIDQEGGRVARMKPPEWEAYPAGSAFAALYDIAPASAIQAVRANAQLLAMDLAEVGITVDYTPLLDMPQEGAHDVIGDRALGTDPMQVAALGRAVLDGLSRHGVVGCIKHMPGHGRALVDSHKDLPTVTASAEELEHDIAPFAKLADVPMAMTAHIRFTAWDADHPATQSEFVIDKIIRQRIGFSGLLLTDDIDMQALGGTIPERSEKAIAAGCDLVLNCWGKMDDMIGTVNVLPAITDETRMRLDSAMKGAGTISDETPRAEILAQRDSLLALVGEAA